MVGDNANVALENLNYNNELSQSNQTTDEQDYSVIEDSQSQLKDKLIVKSNLSSLLSRCRKLVCLFSHSNNLTQQLLNEQSEKKVDGKTVKKVAFIQDIKTR